MISRESANRAIRLQTTAIPATRLAGFAVVCALIPIYNAAVYGSPRWSLVGGFAAIASLYCLGSWLALKTFFVRCHRVPLGDVFLVADILPLLLAIQLTGGPRSWLFLILAGRCVDQLTGGFRRTVWFNHAITGSYASYLLVSVTLLSFAPRGEVPWALIAVKVSLLYALGWYCSITARTVDAVRARARRTELSRRTTAETAGATAHALRTSADGIAVLTELLAETNLDARQKRYVGSLAEYSRDVLKRIPLLNASPVIENPAAVQQVPLSPHSLIEEAAALLRPFAESKRLDFRLEIHRHVPHSIVGDAAKIRQVLLALTHNALRFTETGFVELSCWRLWPGHIAFQVRDSGPGIPAHVQRRISEGFLRADGTEWHRNHGSQIGLSISKRLVESMSGRLVVESDPWKGTSVRIELPIQGTASFFAVHSFGKEKTAPVALQGGRPLPGGERERS